MKMYSFEDILKELSILTEIYHSIFLNTHIIILDFNKKKVHYYYDRLITKNFFKSYTSGEFLILYNNFKTSNISIFKRETVFDFKGNSIESKLDDKRDLRAIFGSFINVKVMSWLSKFDYRILDYPLLQKEKEKFKNIFFFSFSDPIIDLEQQTMIPEEIVKAIRSYSIIEKIEQKESKKK